MDFTLCFFYYFIFLRQQVGIDPSGCENWAVLFLKQRLLGFFPSSSSVTFFPSTMSFKDNPCRKFQANIFNKSKCQNCFKPRESHLLNDEDLNQVNKCFSFFFSNTEFIIFLTCDIACVTYINERRKPSLNICVWCAYFKGLVMCQQTVKCKG